eukprot:COSAG06_NODE_16980_length_969_cov_1.156322_2_plen_91_part_01
MAQKDAFPYRAILIHPLAGARVGEQAYLQIASQQPAASSQHDRQASQARAFHCDASRAWPGLAWPGLAWPGLAWPGLAGQGRAGQGRAGQG